MKRSLAIILALCVATLGACGDDDDTTSDQGTTSSTTAGDDSGDGSGDGEQAAGDGDFCSAYTELLAGDPTPEQIQALGDVAPDEAIDAIDALAEGFESGGDEFFNSDEFNEAFGTLSQAALDECADDTIEVTAVDYGFEGIPEELETGTLGVDFANSGDEFHEMIVFRKNDDTAESFDEIFAMEDEGAAEALITAVGAAFAPPGGASSGIYDLTEPGDYIAVCFIPLGSTPEAEESEGPPHFTQGMMTQFTVG